MGKETVADKQKTQPPTKYRKLGFCFYAAGFAMPLIPVFFAAYCLATLFSQDEAKRRQAKDGFIGLGLGVLIVTPLILLLLSYFLRSLGIY